MSDPWDGGGLLHGAAGAVYKGIDYSENHADAALAELKAELDKLTEMLATITNIPFVDIHLPVIKSTVDPFQMPGNVPTHPANLDFNLPAPPAKPKNLEVALPTKPGRPGNLSYTLPPVPVAPGNLDLNLPDAPVRPDGLTFITPPAPIITPIVPNFPFLSFYSSELLTNVKTILNNLILNLRSTGLNPVIEQQYWDRGRERTAAVAQAAINRIGRQYQSAGWTMPIGDEMELVFEAMEQQDVDNITESRSIANAQAELEQKNFQFSLTQASQLEGILGNMFVAIETMLVEEEKTRVLALADLNRQNVEVFKVEVDAEVSLLNGKLGVYKTDSEVYKTIAETEIGVVKGKVDIYSAETVAYKAVSDVDIALVNSQLDIYKTDAEVYKTESDVDIAVSNNHLEVYKTDAEVYKVVTGADIEVNKGKIEVYKVDTEAFGTLAHVQVEKSNAQIAIQEAELNFDVKEAELQIESIKANIATMLAQKELSIKTLQTVAQLLAQLIAGYTSSIHFGASISGSAGLSGSSSYSVSQSFPHNPTDGFVT